MSSETEKPAQPKSVLVAIGNQAHGKDISSVIKSDHGVESPNIISDGDEAWKALQDGGIDFIILDWKLPKKSGLMLFNRIRQDDRYQQVPVLVVSDLVQKENFFLLRDYALVGLADGEFSAATISLKFDLLMKEARWYSENNAALDKITSELKANPSKAKTDLAELIKLAPSQLPALTTAAKKFRDLGFFPEAESLLHDALKIDDTHATATMELAKIHHLSGRHKEAMELMKTQNFSMKNIERLLLIGEINLAEKQPDEARKVFLNALDIDPDQEAAKAGVLVADNMKNFLEKNDANTLPQSFASLLNVVAISMVKSGQQEAGIEQYKAALAFIHDKVAQARIMYNIGLGYLRWSKKPEAIDWFTQSAKAGGTEFPKATEYLTRLNATGKTTEAPGKDDKEQDLERDLERDAS